VYPKVSWAGLICRIRPCFRRQRLPNAGRLLTHSLTAALDQL